MAEFAFSDSESDGIGNDIGGDYEEWLLKEEETRRKRQVLYHTNSIRRAEEKLIELRYRKREWVNNLLFYKNEVANQLSSDTCGGKWRDERNIYNLEREIRKIAHDISYSEDVAKTGHTEIKRIFQSAEKYSRPMDIFNRRESSVPMDEMVERRAGMGLGKKMASPAQLNC